MLMLVCATCAFAQTGLGRMPKWRVGVVAAPEFAYRSLFTTAAGGVLKQYLDELQGPIWGFSAGVAVFYQKDERMQLESGLFFSRGGYREKKWRALFWPMPDPLLPMRARFADRVDYLNLPLKVNFVPFKKHMGFFVSTAVLLQMRLAAKTISCFEYTDGHRESTARDISQQTPLHDFGLSMQLGFGWQKAIGSRHWLRVEPFFRHMLTPFNEGSNASYYFYSAGVRAGWSLGL